MHCVLRSESLYSNPAVFQPSFNSNSMCENENPISYPSLTIYHHHSHPQHNNNGHKIELEFVHFFFPPSTFSYVFCQSFRVKFKWLFPFSAFFRAHSHLSHHGWGNVQWHRRKRVRRPFTEISDHLYVKKSWLECAWVCVRRLSGECEVKREFSLFIKKDSHVMTLAMALLLSIPPPEKKVKRSGSADEIFFIRMKCVYFLDIFPFP